MEKNVKMKKKVSVDIFMLFYFSVRVKIRSKKFSFVLCWSLFLKYFRFFLWVKVALVKQA